MTDMISAWSIRRYGAPDQLTPVTRKMPTPGPSEVLIDIHASAVTRADGMMRAGSPKWARPFLGLRRPRQDLAGTGLSGVVVAAGAHVTRFAVGDYVFGEAGINFGANASHICLNENGVLMHKPDTLTHEEAAVMCDGPLTSLNFLQEVAALRPTQRVLVLGASGSLGSAAVQIGAAMGADVSATCSPRNMGLVASLGANSVIDYTSEDPLGYAKRYDVIYDTLGVSSFRRSKQALTRTGRYVCPVLSAGLLVALMRTALAGSRKAQFSATGLLKPAVLRGMLDQLVQMVDKDRFTLVMDRCYPLEQLIEAHQYMETGRKRGNVVVT